MQLTRREWMVRAMAATACGLSVEPQHADALSASPIETVLGPVSADTLGPTLMHEHVLVDFIGADRIRRDRYEPDAVFARMRPFLEQAKAAGCRTIVECTPAWLGRDPWLLQRLSRATGVILLTNTGIYGAAHDKFVPAAARTMSAEQLAENWITEARNGIEGTGIKPAFMKIGVDAGPLSELDAKLVRAAALTHRATGLPIASHTGDGVAAMAQLDLLASLNVPPGAFIWVHAQNEENRDLHRQAAARGGWVEFDGIGEDSVDAHVALVRNMRNKGQLARTLVSQDAGWYNVGDSDGGSPRPYTTLFERFLPALRKAGLSAAEERRLIVDNPREALTPRLLARRA
jgi:predicted metal-dependent phosphotriesterase family hydrolase